MGWGLGLLPSAFVNHPRNFSFAKTIKSKKVTDPDLVQLKDAGEGVG